MTNELQVMIKAAYVGGKILKKHFGKSVKSLTKTMPSDIQTKADVESENGIMSVLCQSFPGYCTYTEEKGRHDKDSEYTWVIDPMDGSNNFVLGLPYFSVSIALMKGDEVIAGVVNNPLLGKMYYAEKGKGAHIGASKLSVNQTDDIKHSSVVFAHGYSSSIVFNNHVFNKLVAKDVKRILTNWSTALDLCLLASGKIECVINRGNQLYDFAAGKLIAREAGALITDFDGHVDFNDKNDTFLVSNGTEVHKELVGVVN